MCENDYLRTFLNAVFISTIYLVIGSEWSFGLFHSIVAFLSLQIMESIGGQRGTSKYSLIKGGRRREMNWWSSVPLTLSSILAVLISTSVFTVHAITPECQPLAFGRESFVPMILKEHSQITFFAILTEDKHTRMRHHSYQSLFHRQSTCMR